MKLSECPADGKTFGDGTGYFRINHFRRAVIQIFGRNDIQVTESPQLAQSTDVRSCLLKSITGVDIHSPGRDIQHFGALAQPVAMRSLIVSISYLLPSSSNSGSTILRVRDSSRIVASTNISFPISIPSFIHTNLPNYRTPYPAKRDFSYLYATK